MSIASAAALELAMLLAQDQYLTCNSELTFFKKRMPRITNFSVGYLTQSFNGSSSSPLVGSTGKQTMTIQRVSDLIGPTYVRSILPALNTVAIVGGAGRQAAADEVNPAAHAAPVKESTEEPALVADGEGFCYVDAVAFYMIETAILHVGGHKMDELSSEQQWLEWVRTRPDECLLKESIGIGSEAERCSRAHRTQTVYTPLQFYYSQAACHYLPGIALSAHEIRFDFTGRRTTDLWGGVGDQAVVDTDQHARIDTALKSVQQTLIYEGVFLDSMERQQHARTIHQYVVQMNQFQDFRGIAKGQSTIDRDLNMNHPVSVLIVALRLDKHVDPPAKFGALEKDLIQPVKDSKAAGEFKTPKLWNDFSNGQQLASGSERQNPIDSIQLRFNNYDRMIDFNDGDVGGLFTEVMPEAHGLKGATHDAFAAHMCFGLDASSGVQYTGSANFSAADNVKLVVRRKSAPHAHYSGGGAFNDADYQVEYDQCSLYVFAKSWNVVNIQSGMAALSFAN